MRRIATPERPHWRQRATELGFTFHSPGGDAYWDESAYYAFSLAEIEDGIEAPTAALEKLCREAVDRVVRDDRLMARVGIPDTAFDLVRTSWQEGHPSLYGRFDFSHDGRGPAKLLEYNADTPTSLYEAGAFQWFWLEDQIAAGVLPAAADQFNSIHERLVARFGELAGQGLLHLTCVAASPEDRGTIAYIDECARQGGFSTAFVDIGDIGLDRAGQFVDLQGRRILRLFKLYPWEWMLAEPFAAAIPGSGTGFLEPPWKVVLSSKGILPILWEMAPGHPNLLEAYFEDDPRAAKLAGACAVKPLYSREGANVELRAGGAVTDSDGGPYGDQRRIVQALAPLPVHAGNHAVVGSWIVAGEPAGLGMREDASAITKNTSRFVPHAIVG
jgi:glutathionylspermidine synthase